MVSAGSIARWNSLRRLKLKSTARKADSAAKNERRQKFGSQFVLEFEGEWVCIRFKVGAFMPRFLPGSLRDHKDVTLPSAAGRSFWLNGSALARKNHTLKKAARSLRAGVSRL